MSTGCGVGAGIAAAGLAAAFLPLLDVLVLAEDVVVLVVPVVVGAGVVSAGGASGVVVTEVGLMSPRAATGVVFCSGLLHAASRIRAAPATSNRARLDIPM
jgi:hypothetical protein